MRCIAPFARCAPSVRGGIVALSSPFGQRGWFWQEWETNPEFKKIKVPWQQCPRITPAFIESERRALGDAWISQEYGCSFNALTGLVYPDFEQCLVAEEDCPALDHQQLVGGIDFGWRNPFAAVWGVLDRDDCLWVLGERYLSQTPLHEHRDALKALGSVTWYADPAGRTECEELRVAGLVVRQGDNDIRSGISAVNARLRTGRLKVCETACPNLVREARLYRYPTEVEKANLGENPIDANNHALAALRYLISRLDERFIARLRRKKPLEGSGAEDRTEQLEPTPKKERPWLRLDNEELWR